MSVEVQVGDRLWMNYGNSTLVVGHVLEASPNNELICVSPVPYDVWKKSTWEEKGQLPSIWFELKNCCYLCHTPYADLKKQDESVTQRAGFLP